MIQLFLKDMKLFTVLVLPWYGVLASVSQDKTYQNSLSALISPNLCQLKLICAISKSQNEKLRDSIFMRGISAVSEFGQSTPLGNTTDGLLLRYSVTAGTADSLPDSLSAGVFRSDWDLLQFSGPAVSLLREGTDPSHCRPRDH